TLYTGERVVLSFEVGGTANQYQWWRGGSLLSGETTDSLVFDPVDVNDVGSYLLEISNTIVTGLTLYSGNINVSVDDITPPAAPQNLAAQPGNTQITLTWDQNTEPDLGRYRIYGGTESMSTTLLDSVDFNPWITMTGLTNGITYYYRVTAVDGNWNESAFSEEVSAIPSGPPVWSFEDTLYCLEDDSLFVDLDSLVSDDRDHDSTLVLESHINWNIDVTIDSATHVAVFRPVEDWYGLERISFSATDPDGLWTWDTLYIEILPVNDVPEPFQLVYPDSGEALVLATDYSGTGVSFTWEYPFDPDGDSLYFRFAPVDLDPVVWPIDTSGTILWFMPPDTWGGPDTVSGYWNVICYDGIDSVWSANGPWPLTLINDRTTGVVSLDGIPEEYALHANYPNPFNPATTIRYDLPEAADVILTVYDLLGREVVRLVDGCLEAGYQQVIWNGRTASGREVPSGIYIARMVTTEYTKAIKMVLLK
ncbi:MAG: T9SS type A sorting domain-containing protein, partial [Fidelibacterota bacterium]